MVEVSQIWRSGVGAGEGFVDIPTLPKPIREIAILVTGAKFHAAYELYAHVLVAELRGLPDDKIATIIAGQRPSDFTREEAVAYDTAAALLSGGVLPDLIYRQGNRAFWGGRHRGVHKPDRALLHGVGHFERF